MWSAYLGGFRAMLRRWPLVLALWLIGVAFGLAFALAAQAWLAMALEGSLATRALAHRLDADVFVDLWYHHGEGLRMLGVLAAVLAAAHATVWWYLDGVVVAAVRGDECAPWRDGIGLTPVMARLSVLAAVVVLLWSGAVAGPAWAAMRPLPMTARSGGRVTAHRLRPRGPATGARRAASRTYARRQESACRPKSRVRPAGAECEKHPDRWCHRRQTGWRGP